MKKPRSPLPTAPILAPDADGGAGFFAAYTEHSNLLRSWLVAYGIGGPVLIFSQDKIWAQLATSKGIAAISALFLAGVFLQVILAALNKSIMWACYFGAIVPSFRSSWRYKTASWASEKYLIDLVCDLLAMVCFAWATYLCFISLSGAVPS